MCCFNTNTNTNTFEVTHTKHTRGRGEEEAFFLKTVLWYHLFPNNFRVRDELETLCDNAASRKDDDDDARVALRCRQREGNDHHKRRRA